MPRLLFEKTGNAVWISHLDLMRVFQRAFRRGGILIRHSQGFTPRAHVSIALPLSVGTESRCELLDFDLAEGVDVPMAEIPMRLNRTLPHGIRVLSVWAEGRKLRELTHLDADVFLEYDAGIPQGICGALEDFFRNTPEILVPKKTKSGMAELDIRPMLLSVTADAPDGNTVRLRCRVCAQNPSLNPMALAEALHLHRPDLAPDFAKASRVEVLDSAGNPFR